MKPRITFRDIPQSDAVENRITEYTKKLERFNGMIEDFHVVVEKPKKDQNQGNLYKVKMEIQVPTRTLVVDHDQNEDVYAAVRDAFFKAKRQLNDYSEITRGDVKHHSREEEI